MFQDVYITSKEQGYIVPRKRNKRGSFFFVLSDFNFQDFAVSNYGMNNPSYFSKNLEIY